MENRTVKQELKSKNKNELIQMIVKLVVLLNTKEEVINHLSKQLEILKPESKGESNETV